MKSASQFGLSTVLVSLLLSACGTTRSAWVPLTPSGHRSAADVMQAEQKDRRFDVRAAMQESKRRYIARVEMTNLSKKPLVAPDDVVLTDGKGLIQNVISSDQLKQEIQNSAEDAAYYTMQPTFSVYYGPRYYYGRRGYRRYYRGPFFYHDDWFDRCVQADQILANANQRISSIDADYLRGQEIPPGATLRGFVVFSKSSAVSPLRLSISAGHRVFPFEFTPVGL